METQTFSPALPRFTLRKAESQDLKALDALCERLLPGAFAGVLSTAQIDFMCERLYIQHLRRDGALEQNFLVAAMDDRAFAFGSVLALGGAQMLLSKLYVEEMQRGRGVGRALFKALCRLAAELAGGTARLEMRINLHNPSRGFYTRMGMRKLRDEGMELEDFYLSQEVLGMEVSLQDPA